MSIWQELFEQVEEERAVALVTAIEGEHLGEKLLVRSDGSTSGTLGRGELDEAAVSLAREALRRNRSATETLSIAGSELEVFVEVHTPPPRLLIVGAVHTAVPLVSIAKTLGFHTTVLDARAAFATRERFPHADELVLEWPAHALERIKLHEESYLAFLSHDPKLDNPALVVALGSPARYVGALGSKKTHAKRVEALRELGVSEESIARIHAPIGLPLGGRRPEEIAVSIAAQLVQARHGLA